MIREHNAMEIIATSSKTTHVFGPPTRISNAPLWAWMKNHHTAAPDNLASTTHTPWRTNNRQVAMQYAQMCCAFMQDLIAAGRLQPGEGIDIIDLGAGYGSLSALLVDALSDNKAALGLSLYPTTHILIDDNPACLQHWQNLHAFQSHPGSMDAIIAHTAHLQHARLHHARIPLATRLQQRPAMVFAHNLLCHLPYDLFYKDAQGQHHEVHCQFSTPKANLLHAYQPKSLASVHVTYQPQTFNPTPYGDDAHNTLLSHTLTQLPAEHYAIFPIAALQLLDFFKQHATQGLCLCIQDHNTHTLHHHSPQVYALHGEMVITDVPFATLVTHLKSWHTPLPPILSPSPERTARAPVLPPAQAHTQPPSEPTTLRIVAWPDTQSAAHHTPKPDTQLPHTRPYLQPTTDDAPLPAHLNTMTRPFGPNLPASVTEVIAPMGYDPMLIALTLQDHFDTLAAHDQLTQSLLNHMLKHAHAYPEKKQLIEQAARAYRQIDMPSAALQCYTQLDAAQRNRIENLKLGIWCLTHTQMHPQTRPQSQNHTQARQPTAATLQHQLRKQQWRQGYQAIKQQLQKITHLGKRSLWLFMFFALSVFFLIKSLH